MARLLLASAELIESRLEGALRVPVARDFIRGDSDRFVTRPGLFTQRLTRCRAGWSQSIGMSMSEPLYSQDLTRQLQGLTGVDH